MVTSWIQIQPIAARTGSVTKGSPWEIAAERGCLSTLQQGCANLTTSALQLVFTKNIYRVRLNDLLSRFTLKFIKPSLNFDIGVSV